MFLQRLGIFGRVGIGKKFVDVQCKCLLPFDWNLIHGHVSQSGKFNLHGGWQRTGKSVGCETWQIGVYECDSRWPGKT